MEGDKTIPRWKSWPMWLGILGALWALCAATGLTVELGITSDTYNTVITAVGTILTLLGVVVNPTTTGITDKKG